MSYPTLMYRCPGHHAAHDGQTYQYRPAESADEASELMSAGWHMSLAEAVQAVMAQSQEASEDTDSVTREELEEMATDLGIKFDGRTTDAALLRKIESATEVVK